MLASSLPRCIWRSSQRLQTITNTGSLHRRGYKFAHHFPVNTTVNNLPIRFLFPHHMTSQSISAIENNEDRDIIEHNLLFSQPRPLYTRMTISGGKETYAELL